MMVLPLLEGLWDLLVRCKRRVLYEITTGLSSSLFKERKKT